MALDPKTLADMDAVLAGGASVGSDIDIDAMDAVLNGTAPVAIPQNPLGADATPAQVIRNAAMGRIERPAAEAYLKSVGMDASAIDQFGQNASGFDTAMGMAQAPAQGLLAGFSEELATPVMAGVGSVVTGQPYSALRDAAVERSRYQQDVARTQNPASYMAGEIGGGVLGAVAGAQAAPAVVQGVSNFAARGFLPKVATSGGLGALSSSLYAAGTSERDRAQKAAEGAAYGAAFGIGVPAVGSLAAPVLKPLTQRAARIFGVGTRQQSQPVGRTLNEIAQSTELQAPEQFSQQMTQRVGKTLQKEYGQTLPQVTQALKQEGSAIIDTHNAKIRQLAKGAAQYAGGQEVAEKFFNERLAKAPDKIVQSISKNIGGVDAYYATADDLLAAGREKAKPFYDKAYSQVVPDSTVTRSLYQMPEISKALDKAYSQYPSELQGVARNSIKALDYAKRALDDEINIAQRAGENNLARSRTSVKNQLLRAMDEVSPDYKEARKLSGDYLSINNAMESGKDFMKVDPERLASQFKALSPAEQTAYRTGVAKQLRDLTDKTMEGGSSYNRIFGRPENQKRLAAILSPEQYKNFAEDMRAQDRVFKLRNEILGGSPTASKQVAAQQIAELGGMITANPQLGAMQLVKSYVTKAFDGLNDDTARKVAEIIFEERPAQKLKLLDEISKGKGLSAKERQLAKRAFVMTDQAFNEIKAAQSVAGGIIGSKVSEVDK